MNIKEIRDLPSDEIHAQVEDLRDKLFRARFQAKGKDIENPGQMSTFKKDIARMLTVLRQRDLEQSAADQSKG